MARGTRARASSELPRLVKFTICKRASNYLVLICIYHKTRINMPSKGKRLLPRPYHEQRKGERERERERETGRYRQRERERKEEEEAKEGGDRKSCRKCLVMRSAKIFCGRMHTIALPTRGSSSRSITAAGGGEGEDWTSSKSFIFIACKSPHLNADSVSNISGWRTPSPSYLPTYLPTSKLDRDVRLPLLRSIDSRAGSSFYQGSAPLCPLRAAHLVIYTYTRAVVFKNVHLEGHERHSSI